MSGIDDIKREMDLFEQYSQSPLHVAMVRRRARLLAEQAERSGSDGWARIFRGYEADLDRRLAEMMGDSAKS